MRSGWTISFQGIAIICLILGLCILALHNVLSHFGFPDWVTKAVCVVVIISVAVATVKKGVAGQPSQDTQKR